VLALEQGHPSSTTQQQARRWQGAPQHLTAAAAGPTHSYRTVRAGGGQAGGFRIGMKAFLFRHYVIYLFLFITVVHYP
jgi:hypothetical protein